MKLIGWIFMLVSWAFILSMLIVCYRRIFRKGLGQDHSQVLKRLEK